MSDIDWQLPPSLLAHLETAPRDRAVAVLLRHSVRDHLPPGEDGHALPITAAGRRLASELGQLLESRLRTLRTSPLARCVQTAETLREGARADHPIVEDRRLGDPGVYVVDDRLAWSNWERLGHEGVMRHLVSEVEALPGMAKPDEAAQLLVHHMLAVAGEEPGIHVFVTHDSLVTATAARLLGEPLGLGDWPWYLEGAFFWRDGSGLCVAYRERTLTTDLPPSSPIRANPAAVAPAGRR